MKEEANKHWKYFGDVKYFFFYNAEETEIE